MSSLPIDSVLTELTGTLSHHSSVVLSAEPGAGKTTRVPIALLGAEWMSGRRCIMLEPRRVAARRAAEYMASQMGERVGETIGYRIRGESRVGSSTRIEIVTEGVLTRLLQSNQELTGVGIVIFDEFHERSIHADLGLALTLDVQENLRPDLRILVMSATLDGVAVSRLLSSAPIVQSEGRVFPVETRYQSGQQTAPMESVVAETIFRTVGNETGDILVFLPGQREIRTVERMLFEKKLPDEIVVHMLFGEASPEQQRAALAPAPNGKRKVILSTNIAETSMTIDGVRVVIDSGRARRARFDPRRGMSGLVTTTVSHASADQRRGRAGRQQPGVCYRLWTEAQHNSLPRFSRPEILDADLAPLALEFARWGAPNGDTLRFLDPPPSAHLRQAQGLLRELEAIDYDNTLTPHGKAMSELPLHPRLAHMVIKAQELKLGALACDVAAVLDESDALSDDRDTDIDLRSRVRAMRTGNVANRPALERVLQQANRLRRTCGIAERGDPDEKTGLLLALAYPERIALRQGDRYRLASGPLAALPERSQLAREKFLAVGDVDIRSRRDGVGAEVRILLAEPLREEEIRRTFKNNLTTHDEVRWDEREESVIARSVTKLRALELSATEMTPPPDEVAATMLEGVRAMGLSSLPWTKDAIGVRERNEWLRRQNPADFPNLCDEHLLATLEEWLLPFLSGISRRSHLSKLNMAEIVRSCFSHDQFSRLNRMAPKHIVVPTGSRIPLDYSTGEQPVLSVRLQEMFGELDSPTVADGKVRVLLHLLSPAHRPLAVTRDLASFWRNAYADVRKEMRGRYPKHHWPDDPVSAQPTRRAKGK